MLKDIKESKPNPNIIKELEQYLKEAKTGELRAFFCVAQNSSGETYRSWATSALVDERPMLAEMAIAQQEFILSMAMDSNSSVLRRLVDQE